MSCIHCNDDPTRPCPIRDAILAGLPGMPGGLFGESAQRRGAQGRNAERLITVAQVFSAFRASNCRHSVAARRLGIGITTYARLVRRLDIAERLSTIKTRSRENEHDDALS